MLMRGLWRLAVTWPEAPTAALCSPAPERRRRRQIAAHGIEVGDQLTPVESGRRPLRRLVDRILTNDGVKLARPGGGGVFFDGFVGERAEHAPSANLHAFVAVAHADHTMSVVRIWRAFHLPGEARLGRHR